MTVSAGWMVVALASAAWSAPAEQDREPWVWRGDQPQARLITARLPEPMSQIIETTLNGYLADAYGWTIPHTAAADAPGLYILVGDEKNNRVIGELVQRGLKLDRAGLGDEGFRILTHEIDGRRLVIVTADTPVGLKHGCQELMFFHLPATAQGAKVEWPMDIRRTPQFAYRGIYMLPCWAAHDSLNSWKRVLKFNSELTLNRIWFWLAGFPLLEQYGGRYAGTDLADRHNVNGLVQLCRAEGMKFYVGGGWFTWHHEQHAAGSIERGVQYYLDTLRLLPDAEGIYLEPAGEGQDADAGVVKQRTEALRRLTSDIWRDRPDFEFAIAIGHFNSKEYRQAMHLLDPRPATDSAARPRLFWWWCWGDPLRDQAVLEHPQVLRWHTIARMSGYHGSTDAPRPEDTVLAGLATSYDPGMGFGNPWNGWGALGADRPREVHPHTMPYFSHQYRFRERCWNVHLTDAEFAERLARRLFDADMPADAIRHYLRLAELCPTPAAADERTLDAIEAFIQAHATHGTPRNRDTIQRMSEALTGLRAHRAKTSQPEKK